MATENPGQIVSRQAGTNVTNHRFVKEAAGGVVNRCDTQGERVDGIVSDSAIPVNASSQAITAGEEAPVAKGGDIIVEAGAAVADAARVMTDNAGRAITFAAGGGALAVGRVVNGTSAGAAGDLITIRLLLEAQAIA
jgi:hypothetical protein